MDYKIISVESRKGGVGKTTAALNLASVLLDKKYAVLFIDVDITGTSIIGAYKSSYWKEKINSLKENESNTNLLRLFQERYLIGEDVPLFSKVNNENWLIDTSKINILQSEIYQSSLAEKNNKFECDPRILFDELHSYWLTEMLKSICNNFCSFVKNDNSKKEVVIILDNSPGFVGLAKSIHEWLIEIGPDNGKFLSISSLDNQDLQSTLKAIEYIDNSISKKKEAIEKLNSIKNGQTDISTISEDIKGLIIKFTTLDNESIFKSNKTKLLSNYQALIVNKVPTIITKRTLFYDFNKFENIKNTVLELLYTESSSKIRNYINYDNNIYYQFIEPFLYKKTNKGHSRSWLKEQINKTREMVYDLEESNNILDRIEKCQQSIDNITKLIQSSELKYLTELIEEKWFPKTPFKDLIKNFETVINDFPFHAMMRIRRDNIYERDNEYIREQVEKIVFRKFKEINFVPDNLVIKLIEYLLQNTLSSYEFKNEEIENELGDLFLSVIELQRYQFIEQANKLSFKQFLATEDIDDRWDMNEKSEWFRKIENRRENRRMSMVFEIGNFGDFYNSFCHAQVRLMDLFDDYNFLIDTLELMITENSKNKEIIFPNINDILNQVIINKSIPHSQAKEKLVEGLYASKYMVDFKNELQSISKEWGLIK